LTYNPAFYTTTQRPLRSGIDLALGVMDMIIGSSQTTRQSRSKKVIEKNNFKFVVLFYFILLLNYYLIIIVFLVLDKIIFEFYRKEGEGEQTNGCVG